MVICCLTAVTFIVSGTYFHDHDDGDYDDGGDSDYDDDVMMRRLIYQKVIMMTVMMMNITFSKCVGNDKE